MNGFIKDKILQIHLICVIRVPVFNFLMRLPCSATADKSGSKLVGLSFDNTGEQLQRWKLQDSGKVLLTGYNGYKAQSS